MIIGLELTFLQYAYLAAKFILCYVRQPLYVAYAGLEPSLVSSGMIFSLLSSEDVLFNT